MFSTSRYRVDISNRDGNTLNSSGCRTASVVSSISTAAVMFAASARSSSHVGSGITSTTTQNTNKMGNARPAACVFMSVEEEGETATVMRATGEGTGRRALGQCPAKPTGS